jgi:hypothetical protein
MRNYNGGFLMFVKKKDKSVFFIDKSFLSTLHILENKNNTPFFI